MIQDPIQANDAWQAIVDRDTDCDGQFVYAVLTTGVYCKPSCPSRQARRENVSFFTSSAAAQQAGYRPCKRCRPEDTPENDPLRHRILELCRLIEQSEERLTLADLADHAGLSPYHLHRQFKQFVGMTPAAYVREQRKKRVQSSLQSQSSVTESLFAAGYQSTGHFYKDSQRMLGMSPRRYQSGGKNMTIHFAVGECALGSILVAKSEQGICAISLGDQPEPLLEELQQQFKHAELIGGDKNFEHWVATIVGMVDNPEQKKQPLPLDIQGTAFQQKVWQALQQIPAGETRTYRELAEQIGDPKAVRAVAGACAANKLAVAIPCHRIIRSDGSLSGYRWGVDRKRQLLLKEKAL